MDIKIWKIKYNHYKKQIREFKYTDYENFIEKIKNFYFSGFYDIISYPLNS